MVAPGSYSPSAPQSRFNTAIEWIVGTLLVFTPLAFGSTSAWAQQVVFAGIGLASVCLVLKLIVHPDTQFIWARHYIVMGLFVSLCCLQLLNLPASIIQCISNGTVHIWSTFSGMSSMPVSMTLSLYPAATAAQLRVILMACAMFIIVVNIYRQPAAIRRLLMVISAVGLVVALLAVYENLSGTDMVYGLVPAIHRNAGPFMNYSHFGQFMNMSVGAALGLLLWKVAEMATRFESFAEAIEALRRRKYWITWALAGLCVLGPITIFLSMTRMGMISLMVSAAITAALISWRTRSGDKAAVFIGFGVVVFAALLCVGFDLIYERLATVRHIQVSSGGRFQMLKDMLSAYRLFPMFGAGLGTHQFVFPMFDHSNIPLIATHAENEYAQLMEECGIVGMLLMLGFLVMLLASYFKIIWKPKQPIQFVAFGLGFGIFAILIHSASDFGQHVPANILLTASFAALLFNLSQRSFTAVSPAVITRSSFSTVGLRIATVFALLAIFIPGIVKANRAGMAELYSDKAARIAQTLEAANWQGDNVDYIDLLKAAGRAAELVPGDVTYQFWLNTYRWHSLSHAVDPAALAAQPVLRGYVSRIVQQLENARLLCPTFGPSLCIAGQLKLFVLNQTDGADEIETAFALTPYDLTVCSVEGLLAVRQQRWQQAQKAFDRYMALGGSPREAVAAYLGAHQPQLAYQLVKNNRAELAALAGALKEDPSQQELARQCQSESLQLLMQEAGSPDATPQVMAELAAVDRQQGNNTDAISLYRKALDLDYSQVEWRLQLAQALADTGKMNDAVREVRVCLRLRPQSAEAQALLASYSTKDDTSEAVESANRM